MPSDLKQTDWTIRPPAILTTAPKGHFYGMGWFWPVPIYDTEVPVVSDGFQRHAVGEKGKKGHRRQHLGVDLMFKNAGPQTPRIPEVTKWYHMWNDSVPALAAGPGHIWFAGHTETGWTVRIDHHDWCGFPLTTYYTHLSKLLIADWEGKGGQFVPGGFPLGFVGNSPRGDDPNHLHFELWDFSDDVPKGRVNRALDPADYLPCFAYRVF